MASIERTAYPRLKKHLTGVELHNHYSPTDDEISFIQKKARQDKTRLHLLVLLKTFERLGYFPNIEGVPEVLLRHLRLAMRLPRNVLPLVSRNTLYAHQAAVLQHLNVKSYDPIARHTIVKAVFEAAATMDNPADLINVAIEALIKERSELPAFSTLDRLARRIRALVNRRIWNTILRRLTLAETARLDNLLLPDKQAFRTNYNNLKQLPKRATLKNLQELLNHLKWLTELGNYEKVLENVSNLKIKHFAGEARALDAGEVRDFSDPKRYALLVCLIHRATVKARDALGEMFIKRMAKFHTAAKETLQMIQLKHLEKSERLVTIFSGVLQNIDLRQSDAEVGQTVKNVLGAHNIAALVEDCETLAAFHGDNYLPLLWKIYRSHRQALFRLINSLEFKSTSQDDSMKLALDFLISNENRRGELLAAAVDLSFAAEKWQMIVFKQDENGDAVFDRRHFEVCVFSNLAQELKSGDVAIIGSEEYGDYRDGLLEWSECEPLVAEFCQAVELPPNAVDFVKKLKDELSAMGDEIDRGYLKNGSLTIDEKGELVLKKIERQEQTKAAKALEVALIERMPERNLLDVISHAQFHTNFTRHFGPLSGSDPKLEHSVERYLLALFTYGCNLGPAQAARHMRGLVTPHMLSFVNRRHVNAQKLDAALVDLLNDYHKFRLPKFWGDGHHAAADGTKHDLSEQNLMAEYHIRYGGYGGIAYHHVSDLYCALFSHFIGCGTWEAVYIIDGLLKNKSEIQPDTLHADTQGQTTTVFGL